VPVMEAIFNEFFQEYKMTEVPADDEDFSWN
jgi:hypothetical protein